jgi:hypothetical protein
MVLNPAIAAPSGVTARPRESDHFTKKQNRQAIRTNHLPGFTELVVLRLLSARANRASDEHLLRRIDLG